jgi:hypothetical protein
MTQQEFEEQVSQLICNLYDKGDILIKDLHIEVMSPVTACGKPIILNFEVKSEPVERYDITL